jgi:peptidoglycan hydrolase-like protein with peptidoglycan-binding domain
MAAEGPSRRRVGVGVSAATLVLVLLAGGGWAMVRGGLSGRSAVAAAPEVPTGMAIVTRTEVVERQQVAGTLGYSGSHTVVGQSQEGGAGGSPGTGGQSPGGTLTRLPTPGAVLGRGQAVYEVDGHPVPLWYGARPAWRAFRLGMADGPDVRQLEANLVVLGFDPDRAITVDGHLGWATVAALRRWQRAVGRARTGAVPLGQVLFLPGPIRVAAVTATVGAALQPGTAVLTATSTRPVVTVALDPAFQQLVRRGKRVLVTLPDGTTTRGRVKTVGRVAVLPASKTGQGGSDDGGGEPATISVTIGLANPRAAANLDQAPVQVAITTQAARSVLAVPISALLAQPGGGYAVEVIQGGTRRRVVVRTGLFDDTAGLVEIAGPGLAQGATVQVPAP